jgi:hypothetical protein
MNTLKNVACLANALDLLCFWPYDNENATRRC